MSRVGELYSVGIDIGTTTTQVVFSRLQLEKTGGFGSIPTVQIAKKDVVYKSPIHFTPLLSADVVDAVSLKNIITDEYCKSEIDMKDISTGAVIITGESARKENAHQVAQQLADFAGDFVVCTAGPDYEAVLAGWGAGAGELSKRFTCSMGNFDIGGGTTNTAVFRNGEVVETFALDIGGRLVKVNSDGVITYISDKIAYLINSLGLTRLKVGEKANIEELDIITRRMAEMLQELTGEKPIKADTESLFIGRRPERFDMDRIMFSGGVAEYIYSDQMTEVVSGIRRYGDIGPLLGNNIRMILPEMRCGIVNPIEKIRATVVGAGSYSMGISGSTIKVSDSVLPMKNIPVLSSSCDKPGVAEKIMVQSHLFEGEQFAVALKGLVNPGYGTLKRIAAEIFRALSGTNKPVVIITECDCAKALGLLLSNLFEKTRQVICLDRIYTHNGDFIDIGNPVCGVVPVIVKTLVFSC